MSCCCTNTYKFCKKISICSETDFESLFTGLSDAEYTVQLDFLGSDINIPMAIVGGAASISPFSMVLLNENFIYTAKILNASQVVVPLVINSVSYDCFQFETKTAT